MAVDFSGIESFRIEFDLIPHTLKICFKVDINDKGNSELVLPMIKSHKGIWFRHVYPHHFVVHAIFEVLVPGHFAVESLKAVQAEVQLVSIATVATPE